jgi:hypothetical protein
VIWSDIGTDIGMDGMSRRWLASVVIEDNIRLSIVLTSGSTMPFAKGSFVVVLVKFVVNVLKVIIRITSASTMLFGFASGIIKNIIESALEEGLWARERLHRSSISAT